MDVCVAPRELERIKILFFHFFLFFYAFFIFPLFFFCSLYLFHFVLIINLLWISENNGIPQ